MTDALLLYGHRGANRLFPENSMPAFQRAIDDGANALETDIHVTRDDVVLVTHDPDGVRTARAPGVVRTSVHSEIAGWELRWPDEVPRAERRPLHMPTLEELLEAFDLPINIDIKPESPRALRPLLRTIRRCNAESRVRLASFARGQLRAMHDLGYKGPMALSRGELERLVTLPIPVLRRLRFRGDAAQVPRRWGRVHFATERFIEKCHALRIRVDYWTINDAEEARELLEFGADGIMSDDVAAVVSAFPQGQ